LSEEFLLSFIVFLNKKKRFVYEKMNRIRFKYWICCNCGKSHFNIIQIYSFSCPNLFSIYFNDMVSKTLNCLQ